MGFWTRIANSFKRSAGISLSDPKAVSYFRVGSDGLPYIDPSKAVGLPAVLTCIDVKAKDVAMLPRHLYERTSDGRKKAADHDQLFLVKTSPNHIMNAYDFWRAMHINKYMWGNAYALIEKNRNNRGTAYRLLPPKDIDVYYDDKTDTLIYTDYKNKKTYSPEDIIHLKDISFDGIKGHSRISLARIAFQKGKSIEEFAAHFYHNKTNLSGWIEMADWLEDDDQVEKLINSWEQKYRGAGKSDTALLMGGSKYHPITMSMTDAQFVENQKFSLQQIAMIFNMPLPRLGMIENANRSNMESLFREYAIFSLQSEVVQLEQELTKKTLRPSEKNRLFWKVELKGLLRGDTQAQADWIKTVIGHGVMTPNEVRELEDLNPMPETDRAFMPLNMIPVDRFDEYIDKIATKNVEKENTRVFSENGHQDN